MYYNDNLKYHSVLIQCTSLEGHHTGERIAAELRNVASTWGIENKINFIVSDNASNMISAATILGWPHYGCYAHKLNLIVQTALSQDSIAVTVG